MEIRQHRLGRREGRQERRRQRADHRQENLRQGHWHPCRLDHRLRPAGQRPRLHRQGRHRRRRDVPRRPDQAVRPEIPGLHRKAAGPGGQRRHAGA